jgi:hypothetical protein
MANTEERQIRMRTTIAGGNFGGFVHGEGAVLRVGVDVSEEVAIAYCTLPAGSPRAEPIGWTVPRKLQRGTAIDETAERAVEPDELAATPR